jgi:hypothetical protein
MGGQAAEWHEQSLTRVRPKSRVSVVVTFGDTRISLTPPSSFVIARTVRAPGSMTVDRFSYSFCHVVLFREVLLDGGAKWSRGLS